MSEENNKPTEVAPAEGVVQTQAPVAPIEEPKKEEPAPAQEPKMPLNPTPADLPPDAEPAVEGAPAVDQQEEEAGVSSLVDAVKPEAPKKKEEGLDEIFEKLRTEAHSNLEDNPEKDETDLETNQIVVGPVSERVDDMIKHYGTLLALRNARKDPKSLISLATSAVEHGWGTTSGPDIEEVLKIGEAYKRLGDQRNVEKFPGLKDCSPNRISHKNVEVTGKEAILAIKARLGGLVRVNLLNSGFWVAIRSANIDELQEIFSTIDFEQKEIGRILGGHFALITDMYLKRKFVDILIQKRLIIESNFKDIYKAGAFQRNLAFHDYDTLMHAVVMLMTRGGMRYRCICPKCGNVSTETLDIGACKFINEDLWTPEVKEWWNTVEDKDGKMIRHEEKDLQNYRENIVKRSKIFTQRIDNGLGEKVRIDLTFREPTFQRFFEVGEKLIKNLNETIDNISNGDEDKADLVRASLSVHSFQLVAPWIEELKLWKDEKTVEITTTDTSAILEHLDQTVQSDTSIFKALQEFIEESRFNYIGTHAIRCSSCGATPDSKMDGFYPLEVQTIFFGLLYHLWLAGR